MGSIQTGETDIGLATEEVPGVFGDPDSARIAGLVQGLIGQRAESPLSTFLSQALTGGVTASETGLQQAVGGAIGGGDITRALAPALIQARQAGIGGLLRGTEAMQQASAAQREQSLKGLLELAGLAMPQVIAGQVTTGETKPDIGAFFDPGGTVLEQLGASGTRLF